MFFDQYLRELKARNIHEKVITKVNPELLFEHPNVQYRFMPADFFSPTFTFVSGDLIEIVIWEPSLTTLLIESKSLAEAYRKHHNALWKQQSMVFTGIEEVKSLFLDMVRTLKKDQEYIAFGVPPAADQHVDFFDDVLTRFEKKGIKSRVLFDEGAEASIKKCLEFPGAQVKMLESEHMSPAEVNIYGSKVAIILWAKTPQAFVIESKQIANSFLKYFLEYKASGGSCTRDLSLTKAAQ